MKRIISSLVETNSAEDYFQHQLNEKAIPKTWQLFCGCKKNKFAINTFEKLLRVFKNFVWLNFTIHAKLFSPLTGTGRISRSCTTLYQH